MPKAYLYPVSPSPPLASENQGAEMQLVACFEHTSCPRSIPGAKPPSTWSKTIHIHMSPSNQQYRPAGHQAEEWLHKQLWRTWKLFGRFCRGGCEQLGRLGRLPSDLWREERMELRIHIIAQLFWLLWGTKSNCEIRKWLRVWKRILSPSRRTYFMFSYIKRFLSMAVISLDYWRGLSTEEHRARWKLAVFWIGTWDI